MDYCTCSKTFARIMGLVDMPYWTQAFNIIIVVITSLYCVSQSCDAMRETIRYDAGIDVAVMYVHTKAATATTTNQQ